MNVTMVIVAALGAMLYSAGVIATNLYFEPMKASFFINPVVEMLALSLGIFFLSAFFYGRYSFFLLLFAGLLLGGLFPQKPFYVAFALVPFVVALAGGTNMGEKAWEDLRGKGNFFEDSARYLEAGVIVLVLALIVGFAAPQISLAAVQGILQGPLKAFGFG